MPEKTYKHERLMNPKLCDSKSFRIIDIKPGVKGTICCPKGEYDPKKKLCSVGTKLQKIMRKK